MKTEKIDGKIETVLGRKLAEFGIDPLEYAGEYLAYENAEEVRARNDMPSDEEVVAFRNTQRANNARQKFMKEAIDAAAKAWKDENPDNDNSPFEKPTVKNSPELRWKNTFESIVAAGRTPAEAEAMTLQVLGLTEKPKGV